MSKMTKTLIVAALLSSFAAVSFAQAPAAEAGASAPAKHAKAKKAHKAKKAASAAVNPEASADKKGGN
jgi:Ni/Co efflux regulator RcnB